MCLPPCLGWLSIEALAGWCPRLWRGSKEARAIDPNQVCPLRLPIDDRKGRVMSVMIGIGPHKESDTAVVVDHTEMVTCSSIDVAADGFGKVGLDAE